MSSTPWPEHNPSGWDQRDDVEQAWTTASLVVTRMRSVGSQESVRHDLEVLLNLGRLHPRELDVLAALGARSVIAERMFREQTGVDLPMPDHLRLVTEREVQGDE